MPANPGNGFYFTHPIHPNQSAITWRMYYSSGDQRVAMRVSHGPTTSPYPAPGATQDEVYYLLSDHLGSTTVTVNSDGTVKSRVRYDAWGKTRYTSGTTPTDRKYTGQIEEATIGLYFYNARWYDQALGRFIQADSIIPQPDSPLAWDRYSYVFSNPVNNIDPSGHKACEWDSNANCVRDPDWKPDAKIINTTKLVTSPIGENIQRNNVSPGWEIGGWQIQFSGMAGFPTNIPRENGETVSLLYFYGISIVFDFDGGIQIFGLKRDIDFDPELVQGSAENKYKTDVLGLGLTVATGPLFGQGLKEENGGTNSFAGKAVDYLGGLGPISVDYYETFDNETERTNRDWLNGFDIGFSGGFPFSIGRVSTLAIPWTNRFDITP